MFYGVDTSCYTTSLAAVDDQGLLLYEDRKMLSVPEGKRGLRQSEAVFGHLQNLPALFEGASKELGEKRISAVCASVRPRPVDGSYMPVFTVGESFGRAAAAIARAPFLPLSHQEAHLLAALWSAGVKWDDFLALHMSGGTTELLAVSMGHDISIREVGASSDLHVGQFIDRTGVSLGLPFPAGPHLEALARGADDALNVPVSVHGLSVSFSGPESFVSRAIKSGLHSPAAIARGVERAVAESLLRMVVSAREMGLPKRILFMGGVAANSFIREYLLAKLGVDTAFASPRFAGDNAAGCALYAARKTLEVSKNL
jgi:N6-L-threonylcarbamoyladenine synthase